MVAVTTSLLVAVFVMSRSAAQSAIMVTPVTFVPVVLVVTRPVVRMVVTRVTEASLPAVDIVDLPPRQAIVQPLSGAVIPVTEALLFPQPAGHGVIAVDVAMVMPRRIVVVVDDAVRFCRPGSAEQKHAKGERYADES